MTCMKCQVLSPHCTRLGALLTEVFPTIYIILESTPFAFSYLPSVSSGSRLTLLSATVESTVLLCFGNQVRPNGDGKLQTFPVFAVGWNLAQQQNGNALIDLSDRSHIHWEKCCEAQERIERGYFSCNGLYYNHLLSLLQTSDWVQSREVKDIC